jgi:uncharacterized protein (DUF1501 family)
MLDDVSNTRPTPTCTSPSRRDFFRAGGLGAFGLSAVLHPDAFASPAATARARSVILVFLDGGLSHLDSFDPKPTAPDAIRGQYATIATAVPGLRIGEKLPLLARVMDRVTLVRSFSHTSTHHETATNWVLSGHRGSPFCDYPAIGALAAHVSPATGALPRYVAIPRNPASTWELGKSAYLGERCESFPAGDPLERPGPALTGAARVAFDLAREPDALRERYGRTTAGQSMLLARRLVEAGTRFVTVNYRGWDHHARIFENLDRKLPELDRALSALIEELTARGTFAETLLVVMSEFGRSPEINPDGGRDHWGNSGSVLFAGAGIKKGFVLGRTDSHGAYPDRPVTPADVAFTILDSLGINPQRLRDAEGRPMPILDYGRPIAEVLA